MRAALHEADDRQFGKDAAAIWPPCLDTVASAGRRAADEAVEHVERLNALGSAHLQQRHLLGLVVAVGAGGVVGRAIDVYSVAEKKTVDMP